MSRADDELAWFVVYCGIPPSEVWQLTVAQAAAIRRTYEHAHRR